MPAGRPPIYPAIAKKMKRNEKWEVFSNAKDLTSHTLCKKLRELGRKPQFERVRGKAYIWWS